MFFEDVVAGFWIGTTSLGLTASSLVFCVFAGLESHFPAAALRLLLEFRFFGIFKSWVKPKILTALKLNNFLIFSRLIFSQTFLELIRYILR